MMNLKSHIIFLFLSVFILCSCESDQDLKITGKWKVNSVQLNEVFDGTSAEGLVSELESMEFEFKKDGLNLHSNFFRQGVMGSWSLTPDQDSLICKYLYNRSEITDSYQITKKNEMLLLVSSDFEGVNQVEIELVKK